MENRHTGFEEEQAFVRLKRLLKLVQRNKLFDEEKAWEQMQERLQWQAPPVKRISILRRISYAAAVLLPLVLITFYYFTGIADKKVKLQTVEMPAGKTGSMQFADGTKIWLNSASAITYSVKKNGNPAHIQLLRGEACFDVAPQPAGSAVTVQMNDYCVYVLGTCFNMKATAGKHLQTTLVSGRIKIEKGKEVMLVQPDEQVWADTVTGGLMKKKVVATDYIAWKESVLYFEERRLEDIMLALAQVYHFRFQFVEPALRNMLFTVDLEKYPRVQPVLDYVSAASGLRFTVKNNLVIVSRKPAH